MRNKAAATRREGCAVKFEILSVVEMSFLIEMVVDTRKLHTDSKEMLFNATRPCLLNGIPDLANRPDLADRSIIVTLPVITNTERQTESEFWNAFNKAAPRILAGLLDVVSGALANIRSVRLSESPRMADFAKWIHTAEPAIG